MTNKFQIKDSYKKTHRTIIFFSHNHKKMNIRHMVKNNVNY